MSARPLVWLYSLAGVRRVPLHTFLELEVEERLGSEHVLRFTIPADDIKAALLIPDIEVEYDGVRFRVEELEQLHDGPRAIISAECEAVWYDLGKRVRAGSFSALGQTAEAGLTLILSGTGWTGDVDPADADIYSMEDLDASVLSLLRRWARIIGRELTFDTVNRVVTLTDAIGVDLGVGFRYGSNLRAVRRRYRPPLATRLYPFGANNLDIANVEVTGLTYVEDYSWYTAQGLTVTEARAAFRKDRIEVDQRFLRAINLYDHALRRIAALAQPLISYELTVADLGRLTASTADDVAIGDTVRVRDSTFGVDVATRVVRLIRHPLDPERNELELAYLQPGITEAEDAETSRTIDYGEVAFLVDANDAIVTVTGVNTELASIQLTSTGQATIIHGGTFKGTASGTGTIRFEFVVNGVADGPSYDFAFTNGAQVEHSFPSFSSGVDASSTVTVQWRARVISGAGTVALAIGAARGWVLSRGAVGVGVNNSPNPQIEETLALELLELAETVTVELITPVDVIESEALAVELLDITETVPAPTIT
jgi:phage minor structural protein